MANEYLDKLRSIGVSRRRGTARTTVVLDEHGERRGTVTEQWNDRTDATVERLTVRTLNGLEARSGNTSTSTG